MRAPAVQHALITGGGGGIGRALATALSRRGARVSLCGRDPVKLQAAASVCPGPVDIDCCDVTDASAVEKWLIASDERHPVDCIIACAGVGGAESLATPHAANGAAAARRIFDVNAHGVINTIEPLLPRMIERGNGRVVIISSLAGLIALPDSPAYSASKAAVIVYGEALRRLLRSTGVAVTVVCPGFVDTDMARSLPIQPPFMWSAERSAEIIVKGVLRRRPMVAFPWQLSGALRASRFLPRPVADAILDRLRARTFEK